MLLKSKLQKLTNTTRFLNWFKEIDGLSLNVDNIRDPITITVDNIRLEDLIEFQKIEFELIRGYYWNGKRNYTIQRIIRRLFNKCLEYKKLGNCLQELYKLIMNSCYGETIQKPVKYDHKYIHESKFESYLYKNDYKII